MRGKIAWITGGGSGIGRAGAAALAEGGALVVLSGRSAETLEEAATAIRQAGGTAETAPLDVTDTAAVTRVAAGILTRHGRIDILVNSAGTNLPARHWSDLTPEGFDRILGINLNGALYCCHAVLPAMRAQRDGLVINISSLSGRFEYYTTGPAYNASKAALLSLTMSLNDEEFANGIRACAICPGAVATPMVARRKVPPPQEEIDRMLQMEDMGRTIRFVADMPPRVCVNEILITPTWNPFFMGGDADQRRGETGAR